MVVKMWKILVVMCVVLLTGCSFLEEAADNVLEQSVGCSEADLGHLNEPDLPNCSKAVACCKFLKGECGDVNLFTPPEGVLTACNANEAVLGSVIEEYQGLAEGDCPTYLDPESCSEGLEKTRENYRKAVDQGDTEVSTESSPSCKLIIDETIVPLNETLGTTARVLPSACEM